MPAMEGDPPVDDACRHDAGAADPCIGGAEPRAAPEVISSEALLRGRSQLAIRHRQQVYFLRQTRYGKLILTK